MPRLAQVADAEVTAAAAKMADEKTSFMVAFCLLVGWLVAVDYYLFG